MLTIKGKTYTDSTIIETVTGNVKAPNGITGEVTMSIWEIRNVSGEAQEWAVQIVGFGKERVQDRLTSLQAAKDFFAVQSKFFI
jgi:hypothetical protein